MDGSSGENKFFAAAIVRSHVYADENSSCGKPCHFSAADQHNVAECSKCLPSTAQQGMCLMHRMATLCVSATSASSSEPPAIPCTAACTESQQTLASECSYKLPVLVQLVFNKIPLSACRQLEALRSFQIGQLR
jgi:hypothetical protein